MKPSLVPLGEAALLVEFEGEIELAARRRIHALDARLRVHPMPGAIETVPADTSLLLHYDPLVLSYAQVTDWVRAELPEVDARASSPPRRIQVPVRYGGENARQVREALTKAGIEVRALV